jgi:hypothetical protein
LGFHSRPEPQRRPGRQVSWMSRRSAQF